MPNCANETVFYKGLGTVFWSFPLNWHGDYENETGFIRVSMHVFSVEWQPRKMQFEPCTV